MRTIAVAVFLGLAISSLIDAMVDDWENFKHQLIGGLGLIALLCAVPLLAFWAYTDRQSFTTAAIWFGGAYFVWEVGKEVRVSWIRNHPRKPTNLVEPIDDGTRRRVQ